MGAFIDAARNIGEQFICKDQKFGNPVITQGIISKPSLLADGDQSAIAQTGQMVGRVRLGELCGLYQVADSSFVFSQGFKNGKAAPKVGPPMIWM